MFVNKSVDENEKTVYISRMKEIKTISVKCETKETLNIAEMKVFQGTLKERTDVDYDKIKLSIIKFGFSFPFFLWKDKDGNNYLIDGTGRFETLCKMQKDGYLIPDLPVVFIQCKDKKEAKQKLLRLNSQYGKMTKESVLEFAEDIDLNFDEIALPNGLINFDNDDEEKYTKKVQSPIYEPTEKDSPTIKMLYDDERQKRLLEQIENSELDEEVKQFLILASYRFIKFDFTKIAEYYAHIENSEEKELFELLALIIIDYNKAIEIGFVEMQSELEKLFRSEEIDD